MLHDLLMSLWSKNLFCLFYLAARAKIIFEIIYLVPYTLKTFVTKNPLAEELACLTITSEVSNNNNNKKALLSKSTTW
jgi:hypothetical protein